MTLKSISPHDARGLVAGGQAVLVDIRSADEHARERIGEARHVCMDRLARQGLQDAGRATVIYHCRTGNRTKINVEALAACSGNEAYVLEGGLDAWKRAGLPVEVDASRPIELQRQVQMVAGSLIVLGAILGATWSPWFHALSGAIGAGLVFAGASGFCGLAQVLMKMPWNRRAIAA